jgi:putative Mg2+ transporter-C (MgtC) family protein
MGPPEIELIGRVALATGLGAVVGLERELTEKAAGLRTLALVALASAAFAASGYGVLQFSNLAHVSIDPARIAAQVVSGIGFLGAGVIIFAGGRIRGVTTAADLWVVAAIGVLCGLGMLLLAGAVTALTIGVVAGLRPLERVLDRRRARVAHGAAGRLPSSPPEAPRSGPETARGQTDGRIG